jgi:prepilin-type N-terminal cleavage/methylation domain-containing protein
MANPAVKDTMPILSAGVSRSRRGITLLELVVVVAIIGLVVGVTFPSLTAGLESVRLVSATDSVAAFLNSAVNRSQRRQEPVEVVVDFKQNLISAYSNDPSYSRELKMPDGIGIEAVLPVESTNPEEPRRIVILPGGSVPGIGIQLLSRRGARRLIRLDPMTGYPRVESVNPS